MDWSKTKTIFIIVFLILNAFLLYQYIDKKTANDYEYFAESSIEEELKENEITYPTLSNQAVKEQYLNATSKQFTKDELKKLKNQTVSNFSDHKLFSVFDQVFLLNNKQHSEALDTFVKENVLYGEDYQYWKYDESTNTILYYQEYNEKVIFDNNNARLVLFLNNEGQITSYEQTYLDNIEKFNDEEEVLQAIKAISMLYNKGFIPSKSTITKVELGYYDLIQLTSSHVLRPVWHIVLNEAEDFYVNAFDGQIIQVDTLTNKEEKME
ncbi:two-component system regulatory protein YycI [Bacillus sp. AGMB 02131]|uniref:Two-component system regulatory protein YycI n=1 Tax=Peribacillus faecalis TaxID=2772559 RepID=A0A927CZR3_9BACI|nr:two-component system regulatory protein YycI [Peribacillus faecalis]MBD3110006.1 two-component system regulatory protein YycI [Peribacillus faecalis]